MDIGVFSSPWPAAAAGFSLAFGFSNGFRDSSTIVASVVSTRVLTPLTAFGLCAICEFLGAAFIGSKVANTVTRAVVGAGVPAPDQLARVLATGVAAAFIWGVISWWRAWPTSNSQALMGGLAGASWVAWGAERFFDPHKVTVFAVLILSPTLGFVISALFTGALRQIGGWMTTTSKPLVQSLHVLGCLVVAAAHGSNDGQLLIAMLTLAAASAAGANGPETALPFLRLTAAAVLAGGVLLGGQRLLRKLGMKFYRIRDMQGVGAQMASAVTLLGCLATGFPASTTQLISGSIVGAGVAKNVRSVRWHVVREIVLSWLITVPATAALAALLAMLTRGGS